MKTHPASGDWSAAGELRRRAVGGENASRVPPGFGSPSVDQVSETLFF
jgi:hypothetical protein